jgi:hypothetical protein
MCVRSFVGICLPVLLNRGGNAITVLASASATMFSDAHSDISGREDQGEDEEDEEEEEGQRLRRQSSIETFDILNERSTKNSIELMRGGLQAIVKIKTKMNEIRSRAAERGQHHRIKLLKRLRRNLTSVTLSPLSIIYHVSVSVSTLCCMIHQIRSNTLTRSWSLQLLLSNFRVRKSLKW